MVLLLVISLTNERKMYLVVKAKTSQEVFEQMAPKIGEYLRITQIKVSPANNNPQEWYVSFECDPESVKMPEQSDMSVFLRRIRRMNEVMQVGFNDSPTDLTVSRLEAFYRIISEEVDEAKGMINGALVNDNNVNLVDLSDWLGDIIVFCASEAGRWGIPILQVLKLIMDSQDSKLDENGKPIHKDGKFMKGPNYQPPEPAIEKLLKSLTEVSHEQSS